MSKTITLARQLHRLVPGAGPEQWPDAELLRRYAAGRDEAAFAALVRRHGPMVWNTCRRTLGHQDAEDVFQATFLVLARRCGAVRWRASVAPWLHAVARRLAGKARAQAARRPAPAAVDGVSPDPLQDITARDLLAALDAELARLPECCRGPVLLCWLEGKTQEETARLLGASLSTVRRRLDDGKRLLRARLARRGLAPAVLVAPALAGAIPERVLAGAVCRAAATARAAALADGLLAATAGRLRGPGAAADGVHRGGGLRPGGRCARRKTARPAPGAGRACAPGRKAAGTRGRAGRPAAARGAVAPGDGAAAAGQRRGRRPVHARREGDCDRRH